MYKYSIIIQGRKISESLWHNLEGYTFTGFKSNTAFHYFYNHTNGKPHYKIIDRHDRRSFEREYLFSFNDIKNDYSKYSQENPNESYFDSERLGLYGLIMNSIKGDLEEMTKSYVSKTMIIKLVHKLDEILLLLD